MAFHKKPSDAKIKKFYDSWVDAGKPPIQPFARAQGISDSTARRWLREFAPQIGVAHAGTEAKHPEATITDGVSQTDLLRDEVRALRSQLTAAKRDNLDEHYVKSVILKMADAPVEPPQWLVDRKTSKRSPGVPTLFASDWHWAEIVYPKQVANLNEYNLAIAQHRAKNLVAGAIGLLRDHMVNPEYPGIVFVLGGDMVSGGIHEELLATDEVEIMPAVLDLFGVLIWCIDTLVAEFGHVFLPCVTGNHGRSTKKIRAKGRAYTSYDWLLYQFLARHYEKDPRITFLIPDGPDCAYKVYNHRYLLTHGDQARGGDGVIGMLGPVIRMDHRKRSRASQIDQSYDTMLLGHFHQLTQLRRLIINGSLKGYDEYAFSNNFGFEPPQQALWMTHPTRGITFSMPVQVEKVKEIKSDWVSVPGGKK